MAMYFDGTIGFQLNTGSSSGEITVSANTFDLPNNSDFYFVLIRNNNVESINHISYDNASPTSVTMQSNDTLVVFGKTPTTMFTNVFYVNYDTDISVYYMVKSANNNNCVWSRESYTSGLKNYTTNLVSNSLTASPEFLTVTGGTINYNNSNYTSGNITLVANEYNISASGGPTSLNLVNTAWEENIKVNYNGVDYVGGETIPLVDGQTVIEPKVTVPVTLSQGNSNATLITTDYDGTQHIFSNEPYTYTVTSNQSLGNFANAITASVDVTVKNREGSITSKAGTSIYSNTPDVYYDLPMIFTLNNDSSNIYIDNEAPEITINYENTTEPIISNT